MGLSNYLPSSRISQAGVIPNAAARPATPYEGQMVYQTDNNSLYIFDGSNWVKTVSAAQPPALVHLHTGTFTNVSEYIPPADVFSTDYDHYTMKITVDNFSNSGTVYLQMRNNSGTSATEYRWGGYQSYSDSSISANIFSGGSTNNGFYVMGLAYNDPVHKGIATSIDVMNPSRAIYTMASNLTYLAINPQYYGRYLFQKHQVGTAYTNFRINTIADASPFTITGNVQVYGFRK